MNILADASLPGLHDLFPDPFKLTLYSHNKDVTALLPGQEILLCRSTLAVTQALGDTRSLRYIATASSGSDHVNRGFLNAGNIQLLDARGSNASAVADYVLSCLASIEQMGIVCGKRAGIIGLGAVGSEVARRLEVLGYKLSCYDPPKSADDDNFISCSMDELLASDLICIHANLHNNLPYPSRNLLGEPELARLKANTVIINASRGDIVSEEALLKSETSIVYCTDVYSNEPGICEQIVARASLCTPHIAGHSIEAKIAAVTMVSQKLHARYQLTFNDPYPPAKNEPAFNNQQSWQHNVLSIYNPVFETRALKQAANKKDAFVQLRTAHQDRHDFSFYGETAVWHLLASGGVEKSKEMVQ